MQVPQSSNIRLSDLIHQLLFNSYNELKQLSISLKSKRDEERKLLLLKYFKKLRIQFVRLLVLVNWKVEKPILDKSVKLLELLEKQDATFTNTADQLYWLQHSYLKDKNFDKVPLYDIPTSIDILQVGAPRQRPLSLERPQEVIDIKINDKNIDSQSLKKIQSEIEEIIIIKLLWENLPSQCVSSSVENGLLILKDKNEFRAELTIFEEKNNNYLWNILDVDIHILSNSVPELAAANKENYIKQAQEIINNSSKPLLDLYIFLRTLCQSIQLDILHTQVQYIKKAYNNRFVTITNIQYEEGEKLLINLWYPKEDYRNINILIYPTPPMECFINEDETLRLTVEHHPPIMDPNQNPVTLKLDSKKISIENLILTSTKYYCYNQLNSLYQSILNDAKANQIVVDEKSLNFIMTPDDIMFIVNEDLSHTSIKIRMFDTVTVSLTMSQRDGSLRIKDIPKEIKTKVKRIDEYPSIFNFLLNVQLELVKYGISKILESHQIDFISKGLPQEIIERFGNHVLYLKISSLNTIHRNIAITFKIIMNSDYHKPSGFVNMKMFLLYNNIPNEIPLQSYFTSLSYNGEEKNNSITMNNPINNISRSSKRQKLNDIDEELYIHIGHNFLLSKSSQYYQLFANLLRRFKNNSNILAFIDNLDNHESFTCIRKEQVEDIPLKYICEFKNKDVKIETTIVFHPHYWNAMVGMENGIECPVMSKVHNNSMIYYDTNSNTWFFKYGDYDPKNIQTFETDLMTLTDTLYSLYKLRNYLHNSNNLNTFFQLDHITSSSICLRYGTHKECTISFSLRKSELNPLDSCVSFTPQDSFFKRIVSCDFKAKKNIPKILNMVWNTNLLEKYLRIELEKLPNKKGLISFIPQSLSYAKLIVDTVFQIEFRFVGNRVITMNVMHSQKSYLASINPLFISSSLKEIQNNNEHKYYLDDSITDEKIFLTETMIGFSDVFFPPLLKRIFNEMLKYFK